MSDKDLKVRYSGSAAWAGIFLCLIVLYFCLLLVSLPDFIYLFIRHDSIVFPLAAFGFFYWAFRLPHPYRMSISLGGVFVLCALILNGVWNLGISDGSIIGGLIPHSDADGYMDGVNSLLSTGKLTVFSSRRPLFTCYFTTIYYLTGYNLQYTLALFTLVAAFCCYLAGYELFKTHGPVVSSLFIVLIMLFYRRYIGTTLTEQLGLSMGALGFAALWRGLFCSSRRTICIGLVFLSFALNARAGTFFILPLLVLWSAWPYLAKREIRRAILAFFISMAFVGFGFVVNKVITQAIGISSAGFSNFSYTLYGLVSGGDWTQVFKDYPAIQQLPEVEQCQKTYSLAFNIIYTHPEKLVFGVLRSWKAMLLSTGGLTSYIKTYLIVPLQKPYLQFLFQHPYHFFNFCANFITEKILLLFLLMQIYLSLRDWKNNKNAFLILSFIGILISVPFVPPWDANAMRAYAATLPFIIVYSALGVYHLLVRFFPVAGVPEKDYSKEMPVLYMVLLGLFLSLILASPLCLKGRESIQDTANSSQNKTVVCAKIYPGSYVVISENAENKKCPSLYIQTQEFRKWLPVNLGIMLPELAATLAALDHCCLLGIQKDTAGKSVLFIADPALIGNKKGKYWAEFTEESTTPVRLLRLTNLIPVTPAS